MSNKHISEHSQDDRIKSTDALNSQEMVPLNLYDSKPKQSAHVLGQPEGPFGIACVSKNTVLVRSLGAARFSRFETTEIAPHGLFIALSNPQSQPFKAKSTLLEFQLFLGDPKSAGSKQLQGIGRIEEVRSAVDVPMASPPGYVFRILQLGAEELAALESHIHEILMKAAI